MFNSELGWASRRRLVLRGNRQPRGLEGEARGYLCLKL